MMESGYKHFSHTHNLMMHEMPDGAEVSCSGCNSSATNTVYVCWQCEFFLHDQCFQATRSRKHPSHPHHSLTLLPYPTYPSNSFYCNSCKNLGTGFSYSCSECDFDLHVQCAYSISNATNFHQPQPVSSYNISNYPNQEIIVPIHSHSHIVPNVPSFPNPVPIPSPYSMTAIQHSYTGDQNVSSLSIPTSAINPVSGAQNAYTSQNFTSFPTSAQNSSVPQNTAPNAQSSYYGEHGQHRPKNQGFKHFSHPHGLVTVNLRDGKKQIACSGCQETLVGKGYSCVEENCRFQLHESCFNLEKEIQHKSHPAHPLALVSSSPYNNKGGTFTCNACFRDGTGFTYHCSICEHDLHVKCATLKETVKRNDHEHVLELFYKCPLKGEEYTFYCDVCNRVVPPDHWTYYCKKCDFGTHLDCVERAVCDKIKGDPVFDALHNLQRLQGALELIG